jgi:hypothetical protein
MIENILKFYPICTEVKGDVWIIGEDISSLSGLQNITAIGGDLEIGDYSKPGINPLLSNLSGLESLETIGKRLLIWGNESLNDLSGLENLETIGEKLLICWNDSLRDLSALKSLAYIGTDLGIYNNEQLSVCNPPAICHYLSDPNGLVAIANNAPGCNTLAEIMDSCVVYVDEVPFSSMIKVYPNPFSSSLTIEYELSYPQTVRITFFNQYGQLMDVIEQQQPAGMQQVIWTRENLPAGIYYFRVATGSMQAGKEVAWGKVVKM